MSILGDNQILKAVNEGDIFISDFNTKKLNPNGYNLSLNNKLLVYTDEVLDMRKPNPTKEIIIPEEGLVLYPGQLYLGKTNEFTKTSPKYVPMLEGRSSTGRLGIDVHICAGAGDAGYEGNWTLEIRVVKPVRIYANVDVCQIMYHKVKGKVNKPYNGKYQGKTDVNASEMFKDEIFKNQEGLSSETVVKNKELFGVRDPLHLNPEYVHVGNGRYIHKEMCRNAMRQASETIKKLDKFNDFVIPIANYDHPKESSLLSDLTSYACKCMTSYVDNKCREYINSKNEEPKSEGGHLTPARIYPTKDAILYPVGVIDTNLMAVAIPEDYLKPEYSDCTFAVKKDPLTINKIQSAIINGNEEIECGYCSTYNEGDGKLSSSISIPEYCLKDEYKGITIQHTIYI